jgi:hypothetical protein
MIPLVGCSVISLTGIIERAWFWWRRRSSALTLSAPTS